MLRGRKELTKFTQQPSGDRILITDLKKSCMSLTHWSQGASQFQLFQCIGQWLLSLMQDTRSCRPGLQTCSAYYPGLQPCSRESGSGIRRHIAHFKFNELLCFQRLLSIQCEVSGLQIWQMCCSINCTSLQEPGHAGGMLELQLKKNLLILQSSGSPKQSFPLFWSSLPQSDGKSSSLPEDRSDWIELGPNKKLLTGLKGQDPVPVSLSLPILCILRHPNKGRGSGK